MPMLPSQWNSVAAQPTIKEPRAKIAHLVISEHILDLTADFAFLANVTDIATLATPSQANVSIARTTPSVTIARNATWVTREMPLKEHLPTVWSALVLYQLHPTTLPWRATFHRKERKLLANANRVTPAHFANLALLDFTDNLKLSAITANPAIVPTTLTLMIRKPAIPSAVIASSVWITLLDLLVASVLRASMVTPWNLRIVRRVIATSKFFFIDFNLLFDLN